jgi:hypothetical protein
MIEVSLVPPELVEGLWPRIFPYLSGASEYTFGRYEPEDILEFAVSGDAHLWVVFKGEDIVGITVTRLWQYPRKKCLDVMFLGGENWDEWKDIVFDTMQRWAYDSGCAAIEASGRVGFARVFKDRGYTPLWQVFEFPVIEAGFGGQNG